MHTDLLAQRAWRRTRLPPSANRGGLMMPYTQDYHDQLMQDMGLRTRRKVRGARTCVRVCGVGQASACEGAAVFVEAQL